MMKNSYSIKSLNVFYFCAMSVRTWLFSFIFLFFSANLSAQYDSIYLSSNYRTYLVHLPVGYAASNDYPLVVAMHGGFGSAFNLQNQSGLSAKSDQEGFIVVYPEGVKGGALNIRTWNAGWCCGPASETNVDDVGFIDALLDTVFNQFSVDTTRVYATGMSNGGFMSFRLACELSDRFAAIAPVASSMSISNCRPSKLMPIIHFHSYQDESIPYEGGIGTGVSDHYNPPLDSVLNVWSGHNGCTVANDTIQNDSEYTLIRWTNCECGAEVLSYITQDGGHSWPGGTQTPVGDSVSVYINATDLMWAFFEQYSLNCDPTSILESEFQSIDNFELYPNPTSGEFNIINHGNDLDFSVTIFNELGQLILQENNIGTLNISQFSPGFYYALFHSNKGTQVIKMIKITP
jgi:polyhydroxybutyrate depolymerase